MICIIPIRSKSKGLKNKNIKLFNGVPLVIYSVYKALKSKVFNKIIIATDSEYYIKYLKKKLIESGTSLKKVSFFKRSKSSSTDNAQTEIVISEVLSVYTEYSHACLIQATSPFLKSKDIIRATTLFKKKKFDSLFSGYLFKKFIWSEKPFFKPLNYNLFKRPMRQKINKFYVENGALYLFNIKKFFTYKNRLFGKIGCYEMSYDDSIDIDTNKDFINAQKKLSIDYDK